MLRFIQIVLSLCLVSVPLALNGILLLWLLVVR